MVNTMAMWDAHSEGKSKNASASSRNMIASMCVVFVVAWAVRSCSYNMTTADEADALSDHILTAMAAQGMAELPQGGHVWDFYMDATAGGCRWITWEQRHYLGQSDALPSLGATRQNEEYPSLHFTSPELLCYHKVLSLAVQAHSSALLCASHSSGIQTLLYAVQGSHPHPLSADPLQHVHVTLCSTTTPTLFQVCTSHQLLYNAILSTLCANVCAGCHRAFLYCGQSQCKCPCDMANV
jgi:hypothetical protein